MILIYRMCTVI